MSRDGRWIAFASSRSRGNRVDEVLRVIRPNGWHGVKRRGDHGLLHWSRVWFEPIPANVILLNGAELGSAHQPAPFR